MIANLPEIDKRRRLSGRAVCAKEACIERAGAVWWSLQHSHAQYRSQNQLNTAFVNNAEHLKSVNLNLLEQYFSTISKN